MKQKRNSKSTSSKTVDRGDVAGVKKSSSTEKMSGSKSMKQKGSCMCGR